MPRKSRAEINSPPPVRLVSSPVPVELPPPPAHLSAAMQVWWKAVVTDYDLDQHHLRLLEAACDSWDRMVTARTVLMKEGLTISTRHGSKKHPAADIERDSRLAFARLLRELDLDAESPSERPEWRPPAIRSNRRR
jgi:P27 family predicted phage terminase small subunit